MPWCLAVIVSATEVNILPCYVDCKEHDGNDIDLDREFLQSLRELKVLLDKENLDEHKM